MDRIVLIGGSGYIGSNLTYGLLEAGYYVTNIDIKDYDEDTLNKFRSLHLSHNQLITCMIDMINQVEFSTSLVTELLSGDRCKSMIILAAYKDLTESFTIPLEYYNANLKILLNSLNLAKILRPACILFSSSSAVYDDSDCNFTSEFDKDILTGPSPYGYSKLISERILKESCDSIGIPSLSLRYANPIGTYEGAKIDTSCSVVGNLIRCMINGDPFTIYGGDYDSPDGTCIRDFINMVSLVEIHLRLISNDLSELKMYPSVNVLNIGTGHATSIKELAEIAKSIDSSRFRYQIGNRRIGDTTGSVCSVTKLVQIFNVEIDSDQVQKAISDLYWSYSNKFKS